MAIIQGRRLKNDGLSRRWHHGACSASSVTVGEDPL